MYAVSEPKRLIDLAVLILILLCTNTDYASMSPVNKLSLIMPLLCHLRHCCWITHSFPLRCFLAPATAYVSRTLQFPGQRLLGEEDSEGPGCSRM